MPDILHEDPFEWFGQWFDEAGAAVEANPNAMAVASVGADGQPSIRQVLLKSWDRQGFVFYTNYRSQKAREIDAHPKVALNFYWRGLERQIRIEGLAERLGAAESDAYFATRARGSQIGAWASRQSQPMDSRQALAARVERYEDEFADQPVPRPEHWGGYRVVPARFEFWEAEAYRLHDRYRFVRRDDDGGWDHQMLYP